MGTWRTHFSYAHARHLAIAGEKVYCAAENGLFYFDLSDNSTTVLSKIDGFNDVGIGALGYDQQEQILAVGYENGNLDFVHDGKIINQPAILESNLAGSKNIHHFTFYGHKAYISMDLGVVVVNLDNFNIRESYLEIGPGGNSVNAYASAVFQDSLFLATNLGVMAASLQDNYNLLDYHNWHLFEKEENIPRTTFIKVTTDGGQLWALTADSRIFIYANGHWAADDSAPQTTINDIEFSQGKLVISAENTVVARKDGTDEEIKQGIHDPMTGSFDANGHLWLADNGLGLMGNFEGNFKSYTPSGPFTDHVFALKYIDRKVLDLPGGYNENYLPNGNADGFSVFENGRWKNYNASGLANTVQTPPIHDLVDAAAGPQGHFYFASFSDGILTWDGSANFETINDQTPGSALSQAINPAGAVLVSGIAGGADGNVWLTNYNTSVPLQRWDGAESWKAISFDGYAKRFPLALVPLDDGDVWMALNPEISGGLLVSDSTGSISRQLNTTSGNGNLPDKTVTALVRDLDGNMWVGTKGGLVYFADPGSALDFTGNSDNPAFYEYDASYPVFDNNILLSREEITCLSVDPGNRKWIGTNDGLWLFGENGDKLFTHFTISNSPMPSNHIVAITVAGRSGEVFIGTDKGIVSFLGTSTEPAPKLESVKIFPNPVKPGFNGVISIEGLVDKASVKITDVSGKLVYETRSYGGTATWNGADYNGQKAGSGIYLVFVANENGSQAIVGKIAIVR